MAYDLQFVQDQRDACAANLALARRYKETQVSSSTGGRKTAMHDIDKLVTELQMWNDECRRLSRSGPVFFVAVPCG